MSSDEVSIVVGGPAGSGVMSLGVTIGRVIKRHGWNVITYSEYPSLIKGGHNMLYVRASKEQIYAPRKGIDVLVAFDALTLKEHKDELKKKAYVIYDASISEASIPKFDDSITLVKVPFSQLLGELGHIRYYNMIALGVVASILDMNKSIVEKTIEDIFKSKSKDVVEANKKAVHLGYMHVKDVFYSTKIDALKDENRIFLNGNAAVALGAVKAGLKYLGTYPMTPTSDILHYISKWEKDKKIIVKQTEDEIAALNSVVGAAFAGVRAMAATSGGGFSLMVEALGMAGMMELPLVIVEGQRGSPSTGMPTHTEQGDLRFVMHASQGEFPRVVLAPGDIEEAFYYTFEAFNIAEILQTPVIVLTDKHLGSSFASVPKFDGKNLKIERGKLITKEDAENIKDYKRYSLDEQDGISYRTMPGNPNTLYVSSSYEHDETGFTTEDADMRVKQMQKRMKKLDALDADVYKPNVYGECEISLVCWGSTKMACLEAQKMLKQRGIDVKVVHYVFILPFHEQATKEHVDENKSLLIEHNYTAQLGSVIAEHTGIKIKHKLLKYDGRQVFPEEIVDYVLSNMIKK